MNGQSRILGGLYGSLVGDALGVPVEFFSRHTRKVDPVMGMRGHGTHGQPEGTWSDDGALLLCSVESLVEEGFDTQDMGERFVRWYDQGHWSAHGVVFDIGNATRSALHRISMGTPAEDAGGRGQYDNGNGSLMRILPVGLASLKESQADFVVRHLRASSITHGHERSRMACAFHGLVVRSLMEGKGPDAALGAARTEFQEMFEDAHELSAFTQVLRGDIAQWPEATVESGGYVMETLMAALWCLLTTCNFEECVLKAVNLGSDTDTTGCVAGGLAGVYYGMNAIQEEWRAALPRQEEVRELFEKFTQRFVLL